MQHLVEAIRNDDGVQKALEPLREWQSKDTDEKLFEKHVTAALNAAEECSGASARRRTSRTQEVATQCGPSKVTRSWTSPTSW